MKRVAVDGCPRPGAFLGNLAIDEADRRRHYVLRLVLLLRGNILNGGVWTRPIPGSDDGPLHTYWVQLTRVEGQPRSLTPKSPHP